MSLIHRFSKFILIPILIDWLSPENFLCLDSALCNHEDREYLSSLIVSYSKNFQKFIFSSLSSIPLSVGVFDWITQRLKNFKEINDFIVLQVNSTSLTKFRTKLEDAARQRLYDYFPLIHCLEINRCVGPANQRYLAEEFLPQCSAMVEVLVTDEAKSNFVNGIVSSLAINCHNLRVFNLNGCFYITESVVIDVIRQCPHITDLYVKDCEYLKLQFIAALVVRGRNVIKFTAPTKLYYQLLFMWFLHPKLQLIEFSYNDFNPWLTALLYYRGTHLKMLQFNSYMGVNYSLLVDISTICPRLQSLYTTAHRLDLAGIHTICDNWCRTIQIISFRKIMGIDYSVFRSFVKEVFARCVHLQEFYCHQPNKYYNAVEVAVEMTTFVCSELRVLHITGHIEATECYGMLTQSNKLEKLMVNDSVDIQLEVAVLVAPFLTNLVEFQCVKMPQATMEALIGCALELKTLCIPLQKLPLSGVVLHHITHLTIGDYRVGDNYSDLTISEYCPRLTYLDIGAKITAGVLTSIVSSLPRLRELKTVTKIDKNHKLFRINKKLEVGKSETVTMWRSSYY